MSTAQRPYLRSVPNESTRPKPRLSDAALIEAVERGDHRVAREIHDTLFPVIDHALFRVFGSRRGDHEDLIQMAFEQVILTLSRGSFARACSLTTWASAIATRVGLMALRSKDRESRVIERRLDTESQLSLVPDATDVEREADARHRLDLVRDCLAEMSPNGARTLFMHDALGYKLSDIAAIMDVSMSAAQSRLVRARRDLFRRIELRRAHAGRPR